MKHLALLLISIFMSPPLLANASDWSWKHYKLSVGAEYLSNLTKRGATLYDAYQVIPIFAIELLHPNLEIIGSSINYQYRLNDHLLYRTRLALGATGDQPLYETTLAAPTPRDSTNEFDTFLELGWPGWGEITLQHSQDLKAHNGFYTEVQVRAVLPGFTVKNRFFEPGIFASYGGGDEEHNEYLYGSGAGKLGATNYSVGLSISSPPEIDHFFPVFKFTYYELIGAANRNASLVRDKTSGIQVLALFAVGVFP